MSGLQNWAAWYACNGFEIFPVHTVVRGVCSCGVSSCESPGKHPASMRGVKDATTDMAQVIRWWVENPNYNIGLHCNQFTVLDVDGEEGKETLRELVKQHRDVPTFSNGPRAVTGGGGYHFFFKPSGLGNKVKFAPGLDLKGDGGYIVAPPSLHHSGKRYEFEIGLKEGLIPELPGWPVHLVKKKSIGFKRHSLPGSDKEKPKVDIESLPSIGDGSRNDELAKVAGRFFWEGHAASEVVELTDKVNRLKCLPPVSRREVESIVSSVSRYH